MNSNQSIKANIWSSLSASVIAAILWGFVLGLIFNHLYGQNFSEISFLSLILYCLGKVGIFSIILVVFLNIFRVAISKISKNRISLKKSFSSFLSVLITLPLIIGVIIYLNTNVLRYSREFRSYFEDMAALLFGLILTVIFYKLIPGSKIFEEKRESKIVTLIALILIGVLSLSSDPFTIKANTAEELIKNPRNYDSQGRFLGSTDDLNLRTYNIILFSIDTLRADGLSCYGNPRKTSPNLDSISEEAVIFQNALSQSSWTLPSHMTMITSLYPSVHGCVASPLWTRTIERLAEHWITLPEILKGFGYATAAFSDGSFLGPEFNFDQGFDICDDSGGGIERIVQKSIHWLDRRSKPVPFFLFLHCYDVHDYQPPPEVEKMFVRDYHGKLLRYRDTKRPLKQRVGANSFYHLSKLDIDYLRDLYDATIYKTDQEFGKLLDYLKNHQQYENTIFIITSDHGEEFWEHGGTGHGWSLHQHQLRVPLIWKSSTFPSNKIEVNELVGLLDIVPSLLDILGIPVPDDAQGISLIPFIEGKMNNDRLLVAEATHIKNQKALISKRFAFLFNQYSPLEENIFYYRRLLYVWRAIIAFSNNELFDLANDLGEEMNIISKRSEVAEGMQNVLLKRINVNLKYKSTFITPQRGELDKKTEEHLRSLGYIK